MNTALRRALRSPLPWLVLLLAAVTLLMPASAPLFRRAFPGIEPAVYNRASFLHLLASQAWLVGQSSVAAAAIGLGAGIFVTRPIGREFRPVVNLLATIGESCPPAAVLALAVPLVGLGERPTLIALILYGLLPITETTIAGIEALPAPVLDAADGMGLSRWQRFWRVELPLAAPVILTGLRVSVIVNIGTATIGSTVGAVTLGTPIIDGLVVDKPNLILQGALVLGLFAVVTDLGFEHLARHLRRHLAETMS